jgi:predicted transcriptional regulator
LSIEKRYSDEIKATIYEYLKRRKVRFDNLVKVSGRNRVTLSKYLIHGQESGEVQKDARTKEYALTPKGEDELERITTAKKAKHYPVRYSGVVDSLNELEAGDLRKIPGLVSLNELPLPIPVTTSIYATDELAFIFQQVEDDLLDYAHVGSRKVPAKVLKDATDPLVKRFIWMNILERVQMLMEWHGDYKFDPRIEKPPPLSVDSILGFDSSLMIRYEAKELAKSGGIQELGIRRRLAGALLLRLACGPHETNPSSSSRDLIPLLQHGGLLDKKDAAKIRQHIPKAKSGRFMLKKGSPEPISRTGRKVILEVGIRYLKEGHVLQIPNGITPESLVRKLFSRPKVYPV